MYGVKKNGHRKLKVSAKLDTGTPDMFTFEELHPIVTQHPSQRWPTCSKCGNPTYCDKTAPQAHLCVDCWFAWLDEALC